MLLYQMKELGRAWMTPVTYWAEANARMFSAPGSWLSALPQAQRFAAANELLYRIGKDYEKPKFGIHSLTDDGPAGSGMVFPVVEREVLSTPFCRLLRFKRFSDDADGIIDLKNDPPVLVVAPLSGHHSTLLRDTVKTLLRDHKVYITDWTDARMVPKAVGAFTLDDYVATIQTFMRHIGAENLHVISVCQPTVPVLAAVSLMAARGETTPRSMVMMGGPIDTRESPTAVNNLATEKPISWFEQNLIHTVPANYPGRGRSVYPGFLQLTGFLAMNLGSHMQSHFAMFKDLVAGDDDAADSTKDFYEEYRSVCDMTAEFYLQTISTVFQDHALPKGEMMHRGVRIDPAAITDIAILAIEGERDDISGIGQTKAALKISTGLPAVMKQYFLAPGAGHYGIFNGSKWRDTIAPVVEAWIAKHD